MAALPGRAAADADSARVRAAADAVPGPEGRGGKGNQGQKTWAEITRSRDREKGQVPLKDREFSSGGRDKYRR
jgi:hypothetical protein